jgi:hypothetical protein
MFPVIGDHHGLTDGGHLGQRILYDCGCGQFQRAHEAWPFVVFFLGGIPSRPSPPMGCNDVRIILVWLGRQMMWFCYQRKQVLLVDRE